MGSSKKVRIGFKTALGMNLQFCRSDDSYKVKKLERILLGGRTAWSGSVTENSTIEVDAPNLWGGDKKEGGFEGSVDVAFGGSSQNVNSYLNSVISGTVSAHRDVFSLILNQPFLTSMTRAIKAIHADIQAIPGLSWYPETAEIQTVGTEGTAGYIPGGSANPIHIIYEVMTNNRWGIKLNPATYINDTSFRDAADYYYGESFGLSMMVSDHMTGMEFIQEILNHISAVIHFNPSEGKFNIEPIKEPTGGELSSAILLDESNSIIESFERPSYAELANQIILKYRKQYGEEDSSFTVHDLANIEIQGGKVSNTISLVGIDNETIAGRVAMRELKEQSTPLAKIQITTNRIGSTLKPGGIAKISNDQYGIDEMIVRIFSVDYGTITNGKITVECTEDIFSLPETSYVGTEQSSWDDPVQPPVAVENQFLAESPYYEVYNQLSASEFELLDDSSAFVQLIAQRPLGGGFSGSYQLWVDIGAGYELSSEYAAYTPSCVVDGSYQLKTETTVLLKSKDRSVNDSVELGTYAYWDEEVIRIDAIGDESITIARGCLDTVPSTHSDDSIIYFVQNNTSEDYTEYAVSDEVSVKALPETGVGILDISDASAVSKVLTGRLVAPYPPVVKLNSTSGSFVYPEWLSQTAGLNIQLYHRNRLTMVSSLIQDYFNSSPTPIEQNTYYVIDVVFEGDDTNPMVIDQLEDEIVDYSQSPYNQDTVFVQGITFEDETAHHGLASAVAYEARLFLGGKFEETTDSGWDGFDDAFWDEAIARGFDVTTQSTLNGLRSKTPVFSGEDLVVYSGGDPDKAVGTNIAICDYSAGTFVQAGVATTSPAISDTILTYRSDAVATSVLPQYAGNAVVLREYDPTGRTYAFPPRLSYWSVVVSINAFDMADSTDAEAIATHNNVQAGVFGTVLADDYQDAPDYVFAFRSSSSTAQLLPAGNNQIRRITKPYVALFRYTKSQIEAGSLAITSSNRVIYDAFYAPDFIFSDAVGYPYVNIPFDYITEEDPILRQGVKMVVSGGSIYLTSTVAGSTSVSTSTMDYDVTGLVDSHFDVYQSRKVVTKVMNLSFGDIDEFDGYIYSMRSNVADTQLIHWPSDSDTFNIRNSTTNSVVSTASYQEIKAMVVDWVDGHIYVVRESDDVIAKIDYTGTEIATLAMPEDVELNIGIKDEIPLSVSDGFVYLFNYKIPKDLSYIAPARVIMSEHYSRFLGRARPDLGFVYAGTSRFEQVTNSFGIPQLTTGYKGQAVYEESIVNEAETVLTKPRFADEVKVTVKSKEVAFGIESRQSYEHTAKRYGYGLRYGNYYS